MAVTQTTLLDIVKANGSDAAVGLIDETVKYHPEISVAAARTIKGISYKTWVRTSLPSVGFRNANEGGIVDKSKYENRLVDTFIFDPRIEVDKAVADSYEDGAAAWIAYEGQGVIESSMQLLGKQFYYGRNTTYGGDAKGFPGLIDSVSSTYTLDAGGTTATTGSSVWAVQFGEKNVQWVWGMNGQFALSDVMVQRVTDSNSKPYTAYVQEILARPGLQIGNIRGVGRIKKLTADTNHTLTDAWLAQLFALFEVGVRIDALFMTRRSRSQLQQSRTVTLFGQPAGKFTGKEAVLAPVPTEYMGVPIHVTDSISNVESLTL